MANVRLEHIYKVYPNGTKAVSDFTMDIKDQEFIVFVGPSGCGKSTTLRMIAGLEEISAGELYIGDRIVNNVESKDRDIAMVFQNYALYPHMTVYENLAFGLRLRHIPNNVIHSKILWAAEILGLKEYLDRTPRAMSGGQRQRVALGRAILRNPKVMLLDEPLSNLDAKLRAQMRTEIANLHKELKTTFIYVTHDQVEAMTLGTRVVVMKLGVVQQIDTPTNLYDYPCNKFVAGFIGTPQMNFLNATLLKEGDKVKVTMTDCDKSFYVDFDKVKKIESRYLKGDKKVVLGIRCEHASIDKNGSFSFKVTNTEQLGNETLVYGDLNENASLLEESKTRFVVKSGAREHYELGEIVNISLNLDYIHLFDGETEVSILNRVPHRNFIECDVKDNNLLIDETSIPLPDAIRIPDCHGSLSIPVDGYYLSDKGREYVIKGVEEIDGIKLYELKLLNSSIFVKLDGDYKGKVKLALDYSHVEFYDEKGEKIVARLPHFDDIYANFLNYKTTIAKTQNQAFIENHDARVNAIKEKYDAMIAARNAKYQEDIASIVINEEVTAANQAKINELNAKFKEDLAAAKAKYKEDKAVVKAEHKAKVKEITDEINEIYRKRKEEEDSSYKEFMQTNKDGDARYERKQEHYRFKENFPREKENDLNLKLNSEEIANESKKNAVVAEYHRCKKILKEGLKEEKVRLSKESNPRPFIDKEYRKEMREIKKNYAADLEKANLLYFFEINNAFALVKDEISNKLIQGLGTKVFTKDFVIKVKPNAYEEAEDGIEFEITEVLDYGNRIYYEAKSVNNKKNEMTIHVLKKDKEYKVGDHVKFAFSLQNSEIYETSLNIRLY